MIRERLVKRYLPARFRRSVRMAMDMIRFVIGRMKAQDPLLPPPWLHHVGAGDFKAIGSEFIGHFRDLGRLRQSDRVLDIGCGTGRMALPLTNFLTSGTYDGIDIVRRSIAWCGKAYVKYPSFHFHHSDVTNGLYNAKGTVSPLEYRLPFPGSSFDFIFLTSVFTHMLKRDVAHYLMEIRRVLAGGGRVFMTAFLLDAATRTLIANGKSTFTFAHGLDGCHAERADIPEAAIAYDEEVLVEMIERQGLVVEALFPGRWRGIDGMTFQDILIAKSAGRPSAAHRIGA